MNKSPKKAATGGDERDRRLKAANVPSNSNVDREIQTRTKVSGVDKGTTSVSKKEFKSKLPGPKVVTRPLQSTKQLKNLTSSKLKKIQTSKMQPEVDELNAKSKSTKEDVKSKSKSNESEVVVEISETLEKEKTSNVTGNKDESSNEKLNENGLKGENKNGHNENDDLQLSLEAEVSQNGEQETVQLTIDQESKHANADNKNEKEIEVKELFTETESNVVESTTPEISEVTEQSSEQKEKMNDVALDVTYDSSITLKSVQIKLNDCLKDSSKTEENSEQNLEPMYKDLSFGKTLRTISGRRSLNRLRHVTLREHNRLSPNSSLFVNTSAMSQDDDFKVLRHRAGLSESIVSNGTPTEKKRKLYLEERNASKKPRTESESNFLNSSFELLKSFRRPVQVSTPNIEGYKFQTDKLNLDKNNSNVEYKTNETEGSNKWCILM